MAPYLDENNAGDTPPTYRIDLSLPPYERYIELSREYRDQLHSVTEIFDDLVEAFMPSIPLKWVHRLARLCLRRLFTAEETEEIKGVSQAIDIDIYLLVAFNVLLDLLMGCTSGGVRVKERDDASSKMLHFRTLDWGMDRLRGLIVQLEFVQGPQSKEILATSITYVGFVGVLTAVRKNLSVSLNFRPIHDTSNMFANCRFYLGHLLVLLGARRSISSLLRQCILPETACWFRNLPRYRKRRDYLIPKPPSLTSLRECVPSTPTTAAYLIFCDGLSTITMEKDHKSAVVRSSSSFIVTTNHDEEPDSPSEKIVVSQPVSHAGLGAVSGEFAIMERFIEDSNERRTCIQAQWDKKISKVQGRKKRQRARKQEVYPNSSINSIRYRTRFSRNTRQSSETPGASSSDFLELDSNISGELSEVTATYHEAVQWLSTYPVTNETTHFAAIMDPLEGRVVWVRRYPEPYIPESDNQM